MAKKEYQYQKLKGSRLIVEKIMEMAKKSNVEITNIEWDGGALNVNREDFHTLKIVARGKSIQEKFYVEDLADFPYDGEDTINKIRDMVRKLKV